MIETRQALDAATSERDNVIRLARAEGLSLRSIALIAGVSHQTVANVVAAGASTTTETQCRPPV
jgi:DNA-directed RNA polymerase specialized sigma24 family protein